MPRVVPVEWMPSCHMDRVITHWTAGGYRATRHDRDCYHILVEGDGHLVRGHHTIADNVSTRDGDYAAHTGGKNSGSIGVTVCCMADAREPSPGKTPHFGPAPMTQEQYEVLTAVVADLCERYGIEVRPTTVLGHGEVEKVLGVKQKGKWDPMVLPWEPGKSRTEVGNAFREKVGALLSGTELSPTRLDELLPVTVRINGELISEEGLLLAGASWCPLRVLAAKQVWTISSIDNQQAVIQTPAGAKGLRAMIRSSRGYVQVKELCDQFGWTVEWDPASRTAAVHTA